MYDAQICIKRIQVMRNKKGFRFNDAMLKDANMSPTAIDNIRRGKTPSIEKLMCLAKYFNCSIDYLVGLTDNPEVNR